MNPMGSAFIGGFQAGPIALEGCVTRGDVHAWATFSEDYTYRYLLGRCWDLDGNVLSVDMLNPSTATHEVNDLTITKCVTIAVKHGFGGLVVRNLAAYKSSDPRKLLEVADPIGPLNLDVLTLNLSTTRVAAWGRLDKRTSARLLRTLWRAEKRCTHVFQWTDKPPLVGRHPLYLKNESRLIPIPGESP